MFRTLTVFLLLAASALAAAFRLYLTDGTYQMVREYEVQAGRVRFYSVERSDWEEIPLSLADLKRTEAERQERQREVQKEAAETAAEEKFDRQQAEEHDRVPEAPGVYFVEGAAMKTVKLAEVKAVNSKGRRVLRVLSPIPIVPGKTLIELDGEHSSTVIAADRPEFYMRLQREERFEIVKMTPKKGVRVVQEWQIDPVIHEVLEKQQEIPIFRKQVDGGLYKIWPEHPLEPGEYAVIEFTPGERNTQTWDFACQPRAVSAR
jgi:hypothetical protein